MFKPYTKYLLIVFLLIASSGQSFARAHSSGHFVEECSMSSSSKITAVAESVSQNPQVHDKRQHESPDIIDHTNHAAHADEMSSSNMSMKGSAAMSNGDCCNDECSCETSTCSNSSLVAVTQHFITASKYSDHAVAQQCSKPKSISFSFFRPPIIG